MANPYSSKNSGLDNRFRDRQNRLDAMRASGELPPAQVAQEPQNPEVLGVEITPYSKRKGFFRKVGEDAAMLAYGIPVGIAKLASDVVENPIAAVGEVGSGIVQGVKDAVDPQYYKEHPLLGVVNVAGLVTPVAGAAKSSIIKTATSSTLKTVTELGVKSGADAALLKATISPKALTNAMTEAYKVGSPDVVLEVVRNNLSKVGVADDAVLRITDTLAKNISSDMASQSARMKLLNSIEHPVSSGFDYAKGKLDPIRRAVFGDSANTAVGTLYGAETVAKNPEGFLKIEQWAEAQVKEKGLENTVMNRQRAMQEWVESDIQYASLTPEQRVAHFENYAKQDLLRLQIHQMTGENIVTTKSLPQNTVTAMVDTLKGLDEGVTITEALGVLEENFGKDFSSHSTEIANAIAKNQTVDNLINTISKLGSSRSNISFAKFSPAAEALAKELEGTGYRIAYAPENKPLSFATDIANGAVKDSSVGVSDVLAKRSRFGQWIDKVGLSPKGTVEGATEFAYREGFTQNVINNLATKHGGILKAGKVSVPAENLYEWLNAKRLWFEKARPSSAFKIRTVFDINEQDLVRVGFAPEVARSIYETARTSLREIPASVSGMGDKVVNFLRSSNSDFGEWASRVYDGYLKTAYSGRYDWSPFFAAQQWIETKINSALLMKDARVLPGGGSITKLGDWTADKLGKQLLETKDFLKKVVEEPTLDEIAIVQDEVLGNLQKTMFDSSRPDMLQIQNSSLGGRKGLKEKAIFEQSIKSTNHIYAVLGQSNARMATTLSKGLASKFGMTLEEALSTTIVNGVKKYNNPQVAQIIKEATQTAFHYKPGILTSPLVKTMNMVWYPMRFQIKTAQLAARWVNSLSPASRLTVMNNWVHFSNWASSKDGEKWRNKNKNTLYKILNYTMSYEQMGKSAEAVTNGKLFGGNAGMIGGVPLGVLVNIARELAIIGEDKQINPKTGLPFKRETSKEIVSTSALATALEQLAVSIMPSTPFYTLTGGAISGSSISGFVKNLIDQVVAIGASGVSGKTVEQEKASIKRQRVTVPNDYTRF